MFTNINKYMTCVELSIWGAGQSGRGYSVSSGRVTAFPGLAVSDRIRRTENTPRFARDRLLLPMTLTGRVADQHDLPVSVRHIVDLLVSLIIAVILVRSFQIEGYMITTGSMAPRLAGYHKQVVCPSCRHPFVFGVASDVDASPPRAAAMSQVRDLCTCPNCGQIEIDVAGVPRNQGDQLLVDKAAFVLRTPRRWEVAVFRNPQKPTEAYVKRIVGLPGERVQLKKGDIFINGRRLQKDYQHQLALRVLVHDATYSPSDEKWYPRWEQDTGWSHEGTGFRFESRRSAAEPAWLHYRHWLRSGGFHETSVKLSPAAVAGWTTSAATPDRFEQIRFEPHLSRLVCRGVLSRELSSRLIQKSSNPAWRSAIEQLQTKSHFAPVGDRYGYNADDPYRVVDDLMVSFRLNPLRGPGRFLVRMVSPTGDVRVVFDRQDAEVRVCHDGNGVCLQRSLLPPDVWTQPMHVEVSTIDGRVTVAVNARIVLEPIAIPGDASRVRVLTDPMVQLGAAGLDVTVDEIRIYRDIFYTAGRARHGIDEPCELGPDEYFVLGDNSPVSSDSRNWREATVPHRLLIGKPFLVHLPSRAGRVQTGSAWRTYRVPDFSRMRYIH